MPYPRYFSANYQDVPASCAVTTKFNDGAPGDTTTYEEIVTGMPASMTGIVDCSSGGPASPVHQIKAETLTNAPLTGWLADYSNDGVAWTAISTQTGVDGAWSALTWTLGADMGVRYYRISTLSSGICRIGDLRLYDAHGNELTAFAPPPTPTVIVFGLLINNVPGIAIQGT